MENDCTSLSTGCFTFRPAKRTKRSPLQPVYKEEPDESIERRYQYFQQIWGHIDNQITAALHEIKNKNSECIVSFVAEATKKSDSKEIPTLTLQVGVNGPEYEEMYEVSCKTIREDHRLLPVLLTPTHCSDITSLVKEVFQQTLKDADEVDKLILKTLALKNLLSTINKGKKIWNGVVVTISRFEQCPPSTIERFIELCAANQSAVPVYFVLGLATGNELTSDWLSSTTLALLNVQVVSLPSPTALIDSVLKEAIISDNIPFKMSYRSFEVLLSRFSLTNYRISDMKKSLKLAIFNHCTQQPLVSLLSPKPPFDLFNYLTDAEHALLLQLPSVQAHIEKLVSGGASDKEQALKILTHDKTAIAGLLNQCKMNYRCLLLSYRVLHALVKNIPGNTLVGKPLELYSLCLTGNVGEVKEVVIALRCLSMMSKVEFVQRVDEAVQSLEVQDLPKHVELLKRVLESQLEEMGKEEAEEETEELREENKEHGTPEVSKSTQRKLWIQKLQTLNSKAAKKKSSQQESLVSRLENYYATLTAPTTWALHEIMWFTNHQELKTLLGGNCRAALHRALTQPNLYLQCESDEVMPDICNVYELYTEHGKLISLHDWLQSYSARCKKGGKVNKEVHAKFIRAVSELHFLGYLKPTKRKTDHVAKLSLAGY